MQAHQHLVIIGNGIAGITLAQEVRKKSQCNITLISSESPSHFSRPSLMYVYMGHMRYKDIVPYADWYYKEQQLQTIHDKVTAIDFKERSLKLEKGDPVFYDVLVLATGSTPAIHSWPGNDTKGVQGLVTLQDLEMMEERTTHAKQAVIVGGGLIGIEMAEMLRSRGIDVTMLVREKLFWNNNLPEPEAKLISNHIQKHGIKLLLQEELEEILPDDRGSVKAIRTNNGQTIYCQFLGIAIGVKPNIELLKDTDLETDKGILVDQYFNTNIDGVYAIGDCAQFKQPAKGSPSIEQLWYTARQHGEALAITLTDKPKPYHRGPWFNSAKFLDIEYQTYGYVPSDLDKANYGSLYWEHPDRTKAIRILFDTETELLLGINLLGVRYRHDLCHYWLKNEYTIHEVMPELEAANFDTEFFKHFEHFLLKQYREFYPDHSPNLKKTSWWKLRERYRLYNSITKSDHTTHE